MEAPLTHAHALTTISEAGGGGGQGGEPPRRSLRNSQAALTWERAARRLTMPQQPQQSQQQQPPQLLGGGGSRISSIDAIAAAAVAAGGGRLRLSSWRRASSLKSSTTGAQQAQQLQQQAVRLENTYRVGPKRLFQVEAAQALIAERLSSMLQGYQYNPKSASAFSADLAQDIKNRVRQKLFESAQRYKLIVLVTIVDPTAAAGLMTIRGLWSAESWDACAHAEFRTVRVAACASVFAFYYE